MEQTQLDIGTIGQRLNAGRKVKGVSISEAAKETRILSKYISAMESDDFSSLSAPVYVKGFIRMYAKYLEIDGEPLVKDYQREYQEDEQTQFTDEVRKTLAQADAPPTQKLSTDIKEKGKLILGGFHEIANLTSKVNFSFRNKIFVLSGIVLIILLFVIIGQCTREDISEISESDNMNIELTRIEQPLPDLYLNEDGSLDWE
jgi:transcriptional regulator with XRE-family HTH domain